MKLEKELSQLDPGGVLKSAHQDKNNALRITNANTSVPPSYSRVALTYNASKSVTKAVFYDGILAEIRDITFTGDTSGSLNNTYFTLYAEYDEALYHVWYNVNGAGVDPAPVNSVGIEVPLQTNDPAEIVAFATKLALSKLEDFELQHLAPERLKISNSRKGVASNTANVGTGFTIVTVQQGSEALIKVVDVPFDGNHRYVYNTQEKRFEVESIVDSSIGSNTIPTIYNVNIAIGDINVVQSLALTDGTKKLLLKHRNLGDIEFSFDAAMTSFITLPRGSSWSESDLFLDNETLYFRTNKVGIIEILEWA